MRATSSSDHGGLRAVHVSRLRLQGADRADVERLHAEWALGVDRFDRLRIARLAAGIPPALTPEDIAGDRLKVAIRDAHGDTSTSLVRIGSHANAVTVEHLLVREELGRRRGPLVPIVPEIALHLLADPRVEPVALRPALTSVDAGEVEPLVRHALDPRREEPMVLVSVDNGLHRPVAAAAGIAACLRGMASVWSLTTVAASRELKERLVARGFSEKFGCYNGGIRILWPGIAAGDDPYHHLLLLPLRLWAVPESVRAEHVAAVFAEMIVEDEDPRAWLRDIETGHPAQEPTPRPAAPAPAPMRAPGPAPMRAPVAVGVAHPPARAPEPPAPPVAIPVPPVRPAPAAPPVEPEREPAPEPEPEPAPAPAATLPEPEPEPEPDAAPEPARPVSTWSKLGEDVLAALDLAAELERDLDRTRRELVEARRALRRAEQERDELSEPRTALEDVAHALEEAAHRFPDALVVLPNATGSAARSTYRDPERLFRVLALLAMFGRNDRVLERALADALGNAARWKPRDSPQTEKAFGVQRTFIAESGRPKLFSRHITLGHGVDATKCLQIYYDVLGDGRIEIAWCGEHRPTVSVDT